jgi:hypothetical protein
MECNISGAKFEVGDLQLNVAQSQREGKIGAGNNLINTLTNIEI